MPTITDLFPDFAVTDYPSVPVCVDGNPSQEETWALLALARHIGAKSALDLGTYNGATAYMLAGVVERVWTVETGYCDWPTAGAVIGLPENVTRLSDDQLPDVDLALVMVEESFLAAALHATGAHGLVVWHAGTAERLAAGLTGYALYTMGDRMAVVKLLTPTATVHDTAN